MGYYTEGPGQKNVDILVGYRETDAQTLQFG